MYRTQQGVGDMSQLMAATEFMKLAAWTIGGALLFSAIWRLRK